MAVRKKKCSDFDGSGTGVLESIYCGTNLVSDEKVDFSQNNLTAAIPLFNPDQPHLLSLVLTHTISTLVEDPLSQQPVSLK